MMKKKNVNIEVTEDAELFLKDHPEFENNLLMGSDKKLYVYFPLEEFLTIYTKEN